MTVRPSKIINGKGITGNKSWCCFSSVFPELVTQKLMSGFGIGVSNISFRALTFATCTKTAFEVIHNAALVSCTSQVAMVSAARKEQGQRALTIRDGWLNRMSAMEAA